MAFSGIVSAAKRASHRTCAMASIAGDTSRPTTVAPGWASSARVVRPVPQPRSSRMDWAGTEASKEGSRLGSRLVSSACRKLESVS